MSFFIAEAMAAEGAPAGPAGAGGFDILIIVAFALVFYFIVWRPQSKRTKEHRELIGGLGKGDEVITNGGIAGKITRVQDDFVVVEVADKVELKVQRAAVSAILPKGTLKSI